MVENNRREKRNVDKEALRTLTAAILLAGQTQGKIIGAESRAQWDDLISDVVSLTDHLLEALAE